jgi:hypothetical protein
MKPDSEYIISFETKSKDDPLTAITVGLRMIPGPSRPPFDQMFPVLFNKGAK